MIIEHVNLYMAEDEKLIVPCMVDECWWAASFDTPWDDLPTAIDARDALAPHLESMHGQSTTPADWDDFVTEHAWLPGLTCLMKASTQHDKQMGCTSETLLRENDKQQGALKVLLANSHPARWLPDGAEDFDSWWAGLEAHVKEHQNRMPSLGGLAALLKAMLGEDGQTIVMGFGPDGPVVLNLDEIEDDDTD